MNLRRNQQGFTPAHVILLLILLLLIGFVGWRVWEARTDESASKAAISETKEVAEEPEYAQPPSNGYRVIMPGGWVDNICADDSSSADLLFLAPDSEHLGKCNTESGGTVVIGRNDGNTGYGADYYEDPYYGSAVYTAVTIDGIAGYKVSYTVATENVIGYPPIGTEIIQWNLFDGTSTYSITYSRLPGDADNAANAQAIADSFDKL